MDNETPKYAEWIPAAGGYVSNGNVVSKSPVYDEKGNFKLSVDTSVFGNTQPQNSTIKNEPQTANNILTNNGITTANTTGSGEDANSVATNVGSLWGLADNTANPNESVISTPATKSPVAGETILTPEDQALKEIQDATARNDLQGEINGYIKLGKLTGQDYTQVVNDLTQKRQEKIETIDNNYSQQIATAMALGDTETVNALRQEQAAWRNSVGWSDAMTQKYQSLREQEIERYHNAYLTGIQTIGDMVMQSAQSVLNFQYNPTTDAALNIAQGYAVSKVKEQMNANGMYYSSMTQRAITKAVAELVPVYQKMARQEAIENFQLLQQTATFLMNLEMSQFQLWKGQLDAKLAQNADKRAEVQAEWDRANQMGYIDNRAAAILGIPAGTETADTRKAMTDKLNQIEEENRKLQQSLILKDYDQTLRLQEMQEQSRLDREEYREKASIDYGYAIKKAQEEARIKAETPGQGTYNVKELISYYNDLTKSGQYTEDQISAMLGVAAESPEAYRQTMTKINNGDTKETSDRTIDQKQTDLNEMATTSKPSVVLNDALNYANETGTSLATLLNAVKFPKKDNLLDGEPMFNPELLDSMGANAYGVYLDYVASQGGNVSDTVKNVSSLTTNLYNEKKRGTITDEEYNNALIAFNNEFVQELVDKTADKYGSDSEKTNKAVTGTKNILNTYAEKIVNSGAPNANAIASDAYIRFLTSIADAKGENGEENFDYNWLWGNTGDKSKIEAFANIASSIRDNNYYGEKSNNKQVYDSVMVFLNGLFGKDAKEVLKSAWFAGY